MIKTKATPVQKTRSQRRSLPSKQQSIFDYFQTTSTRRRYGRTTHGGAKGQNRRKLERPLSTKSWIHLVLKSDKAVGRYSFLHIQNSTWVEALIRAKAKKFYVRIDQFVNVGNHLHLKIKIARREDFQKFLKSITCLIARKITGAVRGKKFGRFWQGLAFTRVLKSSLEVLNLKGYLRANEIEASQSYHAREKYLKMFNRWVYRERDREG
jgi:hypothetical protein